jgi:hypothetical protein
MGRTILIGLTTSGLLAAVAVAHSGIAGAQASETQYKKATFAGGCFWCMEPPFDERRGVISTTSGYSGGHTKNPTYERVSVHNPARPGSARLWRKTSIENM